MSNNDMTAHGGTAGSGGARSGRSLAYRCPRDPEHHAVAVPMLYESGRAQIDIALRHGPGGVHGRSTGQARAETGLSAALAPPAQLPSWQRSVRVAVGAVALFAFLAFGTAASTEENITAFKLFGAIAVIVAVVSGLKALVRRRAHEQFGAAHTAAATAWRRAMFCTQCAASWVPGDRRMIGHDRALGRVLLNRAKADLEHGQD
ncbi:hypothetical protein [Dactylosporangium sp. NPDC048998]|uniref:hypothetical protein n=1 Tax=Dactylosporangium sp. NPDC048998 TaxID=3363976 RepID=UPI00371428A3